VVVEVGGGIRVYEVEGRPVFDPYPIHAMADGAHGTPLVPWPNRLRDGRYFRHSRRLGSLQIDSAFTDLKRDRGAYGCCS
jgi:galactose mutarotase-like enzyme